jgi:hypothetical protein
VIQTVGGPDMASRYARQSFIVIICGLITEVQGVGRRHLFRRLHHGNVTNFTLAATFRFVYVFHIVTMS